MNTNGRAPTYLPEHPARSDYSRILQPLQPTAVPLIRGSCVLFFYVFLIWTCKESLLAFQHTGVDTKKNMIPTSYLTKATVEGRLWKHTVKFPSQTNQIFLIKSLEAHGKHKGMLSQCLIYTNSALEDPFMATWSMYHKVARSLILHTHMKPERS